MPRLAPNIFQKFTDDNGDPLAGGKVYSYIAGTSTPAATYTDESGDTPNLNPVELDLNGEADIWLSESTNYKFILTDANDVPLRTVDDVDGSDFTVQSSWTTHAVTDGQAADDLDGETVDLLLYTSALYDYEINRGSYTVVANGSFAVQTVGLSSRVLMGLSLCDVDHGVTFSVVQVGFDVQIQAALSSGLGGGTIKLSRRLVPV